MILLIAVSVLKWQSRPVLPRLYFLIDSQAYMLLYFYSMKFRRVFIFGVEWRLNYVKLVEVWRIELQIIRCKRIVLPLALYPHKNTRLILFSYE